MVDMTRRMTKWHRELVTYSPQEVQLTCVQDADWQKVRLSMKGIRTHEKLLILSQYYDKHILGKEGRSETRRYEVQVSNYINALKRGGQLNMDLTIKRD